MKQALVRAAFLLCVVLVAASCATYHTKFSIETGGGKTTEYTTKFLLSRFGNVLSAGSDFGVVRIYDKTQELSDQAVLETKSYRGEADIYVEDPRVAVTRWETDAFGTATQFIFSTPAISSAIPVPTPRLDAFSPPPGLKPVRKELTAGFFYPWRAGDTPSPLNLSDVVLYNHGRCAKGVTIQDKLATITERIVDSFHNFDPRSNSGSASATSFVGFSDTRPGNGGFILYFNGKITKEFSSGVKFSLSRRYTYLLNDGILQIRLDKAQDGLERFSCFGILVGPACDSKRQEAHDTIVGKLDGADDMGHPDPSQGIVGQFNAKTADMQTTVIDHDFECAGVNDCDLSSGMLQLVIASNVGTNVIADTFSLDSTEKDTFQANVAKPVRDLKNWRCALDPNPPSGKHAKKVCQFIIRAELLNVFPDELQLVWMTEDSNGLSSGAALAAAAYQAKPDSSRVRELCPAQHVYSPPYVRDFQVAYSDDKTLTTPKPDKTKGFQPVFTQPLAAVVKPK